MPDPAAVLDARTSDPLPSQRAVAAALGVPESSARYLLTRYAPLAESLAQIKREPLIAAMQLTTLEAVDAAREAIAERNGKAAQSFMIAAGIASEKALLFAGQPTQLVAHAHEVRVQLPEMLAKLVRVGSLPVGPGGPEDGGSSAADGANPARSAQPAGCVLPAATDEEAR